MEEYTQITLDDWMSMKERLKKDLIGVQESFVRIGYTLRQIEEQELYKQDGYKSIAEFAQKEYGLSASTVSRFISINKKYSIDGNSDRLRPEFAQLGSSKLSEMLSLPDSDLQMITPETTRAGIRELKQFNQEEPQQQVADNIRELIEKFFQENPDSLNDLFSETTDRNVQHLIELVVPSGNKVFRKGLYFMTLTEEDIKIKKYGETPQTMTWAEFLDITIDTFGETAAGPKTWERYFAPDTADDNAGDIDDSGECAEGAAQEDSTEPVQTDDGGAEGDENGKEDDTDREETGQTDSEGIAAGASDEPERAQSQEEEIAPAQKSAESLEREVPDEVIHGEDSGAAEGDEPTNPEEPEPEEAAGQETEETEPSAEIINQPEVIEKPFGSRKEYFDSLTAYGMAVQLAYMVKQRKHGQKWSRPLSGRNGSMRRWMTVGGLFQRHRKRRTLQEVAQDGNVLYSPEYLALCARSIKDKCQNTAQGEPCIFAEDGRCHDGNCTTHKNSPSFWPEKHWSK